jgi:WhiB family redox-sensing transcriptional regulator
MTVMRLIRSAGLFDRANGALGDADVAERSPRGVSAPAQQSAGTLSSFATPPVASGDETVGDRGDRASVLRVDFVKPRPLDGYSPRRRRNPSGVAGERAGSKSDDWAHGALCRGMSVDIFFAQRPEEIVAAKAICRQCPVRGLCLDEAIRNPGRRGVWGGTTEGERRALRG